ncbi:MAG: hypothetical protein RI897_2104 [Verrucomicrobiota bacterium]|jgi:hypothetical protein
MRWWLTVGGWAGRLGFGVLGLLLSVGVRGGGIDREAVVRRHNPVVRGVEVDAPLWIAQEIYDPARSQNPVFELSSWRWALGVEQRWRERLGMGRDRGWDQRLARLSSLPVRDGTGVRWSIRDFRRMGVG